jgi:hypothetical protein
MNNNNNEYASISNYVPGSTLGASIIISVVLHHFFTDTQFQHVTGLLFILSNFSFLPLTIQKEKLMYVL